MPRPIEESNRERKKYIDPMCVIVMVVYKGSKTMIYHTVLEAVGHTPMIRLQRMTHEEDAQVFVKLEGVNIGGSIKTRTALMMIEQAQKQGKIHKDTILVEPTSGNQGVGLALVGAVKGYKTIIIMPDSVSE